MLSLMQPYLFPYLGYFQLIAASTVFVVHDDVQYVKLGWVNRNRILVNGRATWMTLPVRRASYTCDIRDRDYAEWNDRDKLIRQLVGAYSKAPHFSRTMRIVESILATSTSNVASLNTCAIRRLAQELSIPTEIVLASDIQLPAEAQGVGKVIAVCRALSFTRYLNSIGGVELYDPALFERDGLKLLFLRPTLDPYPMSAGQFVPGLSIIDVLMHNDHSSVSAMARSGQVVAGSNLR